MSEAVGTAQVGVPPHVQRLEAKIAELRQNLAQIPGREFYDELFTIVHKPGWTTEPERLLVEATLDSIQAQAKLLVTAHSQLMTAARLVGQAQ